jgi:hypothetical protein
VRAGARGRSHQGSDSPEQQNSSVVTSGSWDAEYRAGRYLHEEPVAFVVVIGLQVFQHGREREAHAHVSAAVRRVAPGGLFCVRVNAVGTDLAHQDRVVERNDDGGFTIEYLTGPKTGLAIHFFAADELARLLAALEPILPLHAHAKERQPPEQDRWLQWEGIWRR